MKLNFKLTEQSRANKVYFVANFEGGDGDTEHPKEQLLPFNYDQVEQEDNLKVIQELVDNHFKLKQAIDNEYEYKDIKEKYGDKVAHLYDNTPNDPQTDYSMKCYLSDVELVAYDKEGNKYTSYLKF